MNVNIVCIGKLKEKYWRDAQAEYTKRLSAFCRVSVTEKKEAFVPAGASASLVEKAVDEESASILASSQGALIALSPEGMQMTSESFASMLKAFSSSGHITFAIGGSFGLSEEIKRKADKVISFSGMTFPHQLFRVMLTEQLYRAFMINEGRTYHK